MKPNDGADRVLLRKRLEAIAEFLDDLETAGAPFGTWTGGEQTSPGHWTMPWVNYAPIVDRFRQTAYDFGWIRTDFDWGEWSQTPEALQLRDAPASIERATEIQLARMLTVVIRGDRFCEGELLAAFESGFITRIVRRAANLLDDVRADQ